jgi:hypothetical protein
VTWDEDESGKEEEEEIIRMKTPALKGDMGRR